MNDEFKVVVGGCQLLKGGRPRFIFDDVNDCDLEKKINSMVEKGWEPYQFALPTAYIQDMNGNGHSSVILVFRRGASDRQRQTPV